MTEVLDITALTPKAEEIFKSNDAIVLATTGGEYSPWVLGAYFVNDGLDIYMLVESGGKTFTNMKLNKNVAYSISKNDATQDFLQGQGVVTIMNEEDEAKVREMLLAKMPWYQTFVPMVPIKITSKKIFITSLAKGWFPAKVLEQDIN